MTTLLKKPNGVILFEGPSRIDGAPIVVIATGLRNRSTNSKTGEMIQTHIIRADMMPMEAIWTGADESICGDCVHRGDGTGKDRTCYVKVFQGTTVVFKTYMRGGYPHIDDTELGWDVFNGRAVRFGTYGDPFAAPINTWKKLQRRASMTTGYTHQWRKASAAWAKLVMASADTERDARDAWAKGWRTFRVTASVDQSVSGEVLCPASEEAGRKLQCETCGACAGANGRKGSIFIPIHGPNSAAKGQAALDSRLIARG